MVKLSKSKVLVTIILSLLIISSTYTLAIPSTQAAETTNQQKALSITGNVIGVDLTKYTATSTEYSQSADATYRGIISQNSVSYELNSDTGKLKVAYTFVDGKVQMIHVLQKTGIIRLTEDKAENIASTPSNFEAAKALLANFETYTDDTFFGELKDTLDKVHSGVNITKAFGDKTLEVTSYDTRTNFKWYYTSNGASSPYSKFIAMEFEGGFLSAFVNNWQFYNVNNTSINISEQKANTIALEVAKAHNWSAKLDDDALAINSLNESNVVWTTLLFDDSLNITTARSTDALALFPVWRIGITLNKYYGQMYGLVVDVWADTGEVRSVQEAWSTLPSPLDSSTVDLSNQVSVFSQNRVDLSIVTLQVIIIAIISVILLGLRFTRKQHSILFKRSGFKLGGVLLCILLLSTVALGQIATVSATTRGAVVWGAESTGQHPEIAGYWRKSSGEISAQQRVGTCITLDFGYNGYYSYNCQGSQGSTSVKSSIRSQLNSLQQARDYIAVVAFDHGNYRTDYGGAPPGEIHWMFEDQIGTTVRVSSPNPPYYYDEPHPENGVYDMDIYDDTIGYGSKVRFAFINTCESASLDYGQGLVYGVRARGMPFAWMHKIILPYGDSSPPTGYMSGDGYNDPEGSSQCYIGCPWGSPSLSQRIPFDYGGFYESWLLDFFDAALWYDYSINQALDYASMQRYGYLFGDSNCPLQNFVSYWWPSMYGPNSSLAIYGDGNIRLKNYDPSVHTVGRPIIFGPPNYQSLQPNTPYEFRASAADSHGHRLHYLFDWGDGTSEWVPGEYSYQTNGEYVTATHSWSTVGEKTITVTAQCENGQWCTGSGYYGIHIGTWYWLYLDAKETTYWSTPSASFYVDSQYVTCGWGQVYLPEGYHTIQVDPEEIFWESGWIHFECMHDGYSYYGNSAQINLNGGGLGVTAYYAWE